MTFHELAPRLTRIEINLDVDPGSLIEKAARGMRHVKRAVRADLHRFKAFIEMQELETGAWRGVIEDGELVEPHDDDYDEERDYSDLEEIRAEAEEDDEDEDEDEERRSRTTADEGDESQRERARALQAPGGGLARLVRPSASAQRTAAARRLSRLSSLAQRRRQQASSRAERGESGSSKRSGSTAKRSTQLRTTSRSARPRAGAEPTDGRNRSEARSSKRVSGRQTLTDPGGACRGRRRSGGRGADLQVLAQLGEER